MSMSNSYHTSSKLNEDSKLWNSGEPFRHSLDGEEVARGTDAFDRCINVVEDFDRGMCDRWEKDLDTLLVFAGLFSAVVTAFAVDSYKMLQPDTQDEALRVLIQISRQLGASPNSNVTTSEDDTFTATSSSLRINIYYFLSLTLSLAAALLSILCKQWMREYQRPFPSHLNSRQKIAVRQSRYEGLGLFHIPGLVAMVPFLLQAATAIFFFGLVEMLWNIHLTLAIVVLASVSISMLFLLVTTVLAPLFLCANWMSRQASAALPIGQCPYKTAMGWSIIWVISPLFLVVTKIISSRNSNTIKSMVAIKRYIKSLNWSMYDIKFADGILYQRSMRRAMGWLFAFTSSSTFSRCLRELDVKVTSHTLVDLMPFFNIARAQGKTDDAIPMDTLMGFLRFLDDDQSNRESEAMKKDIVDVSSVLCRRHAPSNVKIRYCLEGCVRILNSADKAVPLEIEYIIRYLLQTYRGDLRDEPGREIDSQLHNALDAADRKKLLASLAVSQLRSMISSKQETTSIWR